MHVSLRYVIVPLTCFQELGKLAMLHQVYPHHDPLGWIASVHLEIQGCSPLSSVLSRPFMGTRLVTPLTCVWIPCPFLFSQRNVSIEVPCLYWMSVKRISRVLELHEAGLRPCSGGQFPKFHILEKHKTASSSSIPSSSFSSSSSRFFTKKCKRRSP